MKLIVEITDGAARIDVKMLKLIVEGLINETVEQLIEQEHDILHGTGEGVPVGTLKVAGLTDAG